MHPRTTLGLVTAVALAAHHVTHSFITPTVPCSSCGRRCSSSRRFVAATPPPEDFFRTLVEQAQVPVAEKLQELALSIEESLPTTAAATAAVASEPQQDQQLLQEQQQQQLLLLQEQQQQQDEVDFRLTKDDARVLLRFGSGDSEKIITLFGLYCAVVSMVTGLIWMAAMSLVGLSINQQDLVDPHRAIFDATGKVWAKVWLSLIGSYPTITGNVEQIHVSKDNEQGNPACLYVANHASWLDIPVLCTVLDPVFKFIAKGELAKVPCVGQQLHGGQHILIDREDRRSQLKTFKEGMSYLRDKHVSLMAFPEGKRSKDGRLMEFKRGLFSLAAKAHVPIIPITISHTSDVMPSNSYFPVQSGRGKIHVHIGEAIHPEGKTEGELEALVRAEFLAHLPASQRPLVVVAQDAAILPERELQSAA
jgi:1-acyl-sn-glycerol-3-phosphate acyltransferase